METRQQALNQGHREAAGRKQERGGVQGLAAASGGWGSRSGGASIVVTAERGRFVLPRTHLKFLPCKFGFKGHLGTLPTEASCNGTTGHNKGRAS